MCNKKKLNFKVKFEENFFLSVLNFNQNYDITVNWTLQSLVSSLKSILGAVFELFCLKIPHNFYSKPENGALESSLICLVYIMSKKELKIVENYVIICELDRNLLVIREGSYNFYSHPSKIHFSRGKISKINSTFPQFHVPSSILNFQKTE